MFRIPLLSYIYPSKSVFHRRPNANTYWVVKDRFLAGEYPAELDRGVSRHKLQSYLKAGVTSFIDLTQPSEMYPYASLLESAGVEYQRFPIPDSHVPEDPEQMAAILNAIDAAIDAGHVVYVHCQGGVGRTGTVVACWLQHRGHSARKSLRMLARRWRTTDRSRYIRRSPETAVQLAWVKNWSRATARLKLEESSARS